MKRSVLVVALATVLVAACGSSAGTAGSESPTTASPVPTASASVIASCDELKVAASHLTTFVHYVSLNVGTENDSSSYFTEMRDTVASLKANQGVCSGDASAQIDALAAGVETLAAAYTPGEGVDTVAADKAAITALLPLGKAVFVALGLDPSSWDTAPRYPV